MKKNPMSSITIKALISAFIFMLASVVGAIMVLIYQHYLTDVIRVMLTINSGLVLVSVLALFKYVREMVIDGWKPDFHNWH